MQEHLGSIDEKTANASIEPETTFIPARHTAKTKTEQEGSGESGNFYPGISPEGEKTVRERTRGEFLEAIENSAPGSVIIFGGATDIVRTRSTTRVSGNELKSLLADRPDEYLVIDEADIGRLVTDESPERSTLHSLKKLVEENKDKKVIIINPLYISELSMLSKSVGRQKGKETWKHPGAKTDEQESLKDRPKQQSEVPEGDWSKYLTEVMKPAGGDMFKGTVEWVKNNGEITLENGEVISGPSPIETAKEYVTALRRIEGVAKKLFPERPLVVEVTGHSWDIDVFIDYLAHGNITVEGVEEIAGGVEGKPGLIGDFEFPVIKIGKEGGSVTYRGKTYPITSEEVLKEMRD